MKHNVKGTVTLDMEGRIGAVTGLDNIFIPGSFLIHQVHVSDRIAVLGFLDDLRLSGKAAPITFRLLCAGIVAATCSVSCADKANKNGKVPISLVLETDEGPETPRLRDDIVCTGWPKRSFNGTPKKTSDIPVLVGVAHEMRTPLNAIIGFSDYLLHEVGTRFENEAQREYIALIRKSGDHLLDLVNTYLQSDSGNDKKAIEPKHHIDQIIKDCTAMMVSVTHHHHIDIKYDDTAVLFSTLGDLALRQVLINLLSNAVKYTPKGGHVVLHRKRDENGEVTVSVSDNGIGMTPDELELIGKPFVRSPNIMNGSLEGNGLGLALVQNIVQNAGGRVQIFSRKGCGTTVSLTLPLDTIKDQAHKDTDVGQIIALEGAQSPPLAKYTALLRSDLRRAMELKQARNLGKAERILTDIKNDSIDNGKEEKEIRKSA